MSLVLTEQILVRAYRAGIFPMAETRESGTLSWYDPDPRGILPLDRFHLPRRLLRTVRSGQFTITADGAFDRVIAECAAAVPDRPESWINPEIARLFRALHRDPVGGARAHSIECWLPGADGQAPALAGGLYGLAIGRAFFGESMFSRARDASKVALVHLVARLRLAGFVLLDTQFITAHLARFGAVEIPRRAYHHLLGTAVSGRADRFGSPPPDVLAQAIEQLAMRGAS